MMKRGRIHKWASGALAFSAVLAGLSLFVINARYAGCGESVRETFLKEEFRNLDGWSPVYFPKIPRHSEYSVVTEDGAFALMAKSDDSASAIRLKTEYSVLRYPRLSWQWKISRVYEKGDETKKSGDDYPLRVYVMFRYDPAKASAWEKLKYGAARRLYGEYPPKCALLYIWANKPHDKRIMPSPYAENAKMIVLEAGNAKAGKWTEESVDVLADYRAAFGSDPPASAALAIMNDSDNTHESSTSWLRELEIGR
jgi:hypothetical protein